MGSGKCGGCYYHELVTSSTGNGDGIEGRIVNCVLLERMELGACSENVSGKVSATPEVTPWALLCPMGGRRDKRSPLGLWHQSRSICTHPPTQTLHLACQDSHHLHRGVAKVGGALGSLATPTFDPYTPQNNRSHTHARTHTHTATHPHSVCACE